ncbi:hypothetical protein [uncultured Roseovarius sp.]|uniref:hypothetical protein n=1 Tax=uncultured Roseovarius sp. TaxID=293344 RepID=UPI0025ECFC8F|nr:hypothetical protein [uncultured Roseovarius sp.]
MVNDLMAEPENRILGVHAPPPRPTLWAALLLAVVLAVPVGVVLSVVDWLW